MELKAWVKVVPAKTHSEHIIVKYEKESNKFFVIVGKKKHYIQESDYRITSSGTIYSNPNNDVYTDKITRYYSFKPERADIINQFYAKLFAGQKVFGKVNEEGLFCVTSIITK